MTAVLNSAREASDGTLRTALHLCRGHFKSYDDRPLFGRVKGRFWWSAHARGSISQGAVFKGYEVTTRGAK